MFTALENEIVRILRANLSPGHVPADRVVTGPIEPPPAAEIPTVAFAAGAFKIVPADSVSPPRGARALIQDAFGPNGAEPFALSRPPLQPLRAVESEAAPSGSRVLLRERDDYTVDYVNGRVRLREAPTGPVHVQYFTLQPLDVVYTARLRVECRFEVRGRTTPGDQHGDTIAAIALGAMAANQGAIDGLRSEPQDVIDSGLPSIGGRRVFFIFDGLTAVGGTQPEPATWQVDYTVDATMALVPAEETVGTMRQVAAGVTWDDRLAGTILGSPPPILGRPVTIVRDVGPATASALAQLGITTVGQLARAAATGQASIDNAIERARVVEDRAREIVRTIVQAAPTIPDPAPFLSQRLADVGADDLTEVGIPVTTASEVIAALGALLAQTTATDLALSDLLQT
jgi:hypothetical protein